MLTGYLAGGALVAADGGKPIVETERPGVPEGYDAVSSWRDDGSRIVQAWEAVPSEGSVDDAVRALARMQAAGLGDEDALNVAALFPELGCRSDLRRGRQGAGRGHPLPVPPGAHGARGVDSWDPRRRCGRACCPGRTATSRKSATPNGSSPAPPTLTQRATA